MFFSDDVLHRRTAALAKKASHAALPLAENPLQGASANLTLPYCPVVI
jgi:hypothetical protein